MRLILTSLEKLILRNFAIGQFLKVLGYSTLVMRILWILESHIGEKC